MCQWLIWFALDIFFYFFHSAINTPDLSMDGFHQINLFCLNIKCVSHVKQRGRQYYDQEYAAVQPRVVLHHLKAAPSDLFNGFLFFFFPPRNVLSRPQKQPTRHRHCRWTVLTPIGIMIDEVIDKLRADHLVNLPL